MQRCRNGLHELRGAQDRRPSGECIHRHRAAQSRYRKKRRDEFKRLKALEASGMHRTT